MRFNRYLLFAGYRYYPEGGWSDFRGSFSDLNEAKKHFAEEILPVMLGHQPSSEPWAEIVDGAYGDLLEKYDDRDTRKSCWRPYDKKDEWLLKNHRGEAEDALHRCLSEQ